MSNAPCNLKAIDTVEFGVGSDPSQAPPVVLVPVDRSVQDALVNMVLQTREGMRAKRSVPTPWSPSEKYESKEHLSLLLSDPSARLLSDIHKASNFPADAQRLKVSSSILWYFVRIADRSHSRLTAIRRATQFKGVLSAPLVRFLSNTLTLIQSRVFRLDSEFDLVVDGDVVEVFHPTGFEMICQLQQTIMAAVPLNVAILARDLDFVDLSGIESYASAHPRAARYVASIKAQDFARNVDQRRLYRYCNDNGIAVSKKNGKIVVSQGSELAFLEVLDRRRFEIELVDGVREKFRAPSRERV